MCTLQSSPPTFLGSGELGRGSNRFTAPQPRAHKLALEGGEERKKERERKGERAGGLTSSPQTLPGKEVGGSGSHRRDPSPADAAEEEEGGEAVLLWWGSVPEDVETLETRR